MFDFKINKWQSIASTNVARTESGWYYDKIYDNVLYIGGGTRTCTTTAKSIEFYDINKNVWNELTNTNLEHFYSPILWLEDNKQLYIASVSSDGMEFIDLRDSTNKWNFNL